MGAMADTAILGIGANGQVLNILRFSLWNLPRDDKGVACAGGNGDKLVLGRINLLLLRKVPVELHQEVKAARTFSTSATLLLVIESISTCWFRRHKGWGGGNPATGGFKTCTPPSVP